MTRADFKEQFDRFFDGVRKYLYYRCGDQDMATDLAQETFMKIWEKQIDLERGREMNLLLKIAMNQLISQKRKEKTAMNYRNLIADETETFGPDSALEYSQLADRYAESLQKMPEGQRQVFLMSRTDDLSYKEISQTLGLSVKAVEKRMSLALAALRRDLL